MMSILKITLRTLQYLWIRGDRVIETFEQIVEASKAGCIDKNDFVKDGIIHCGYCGKPKQKTIHCLNRDWFVTFLCKCQVKANAEKQEAEAKKKLIQDRMQDCFRSLTVHNEDDDDPESKAASICRGYAKQFSREAKWAVLYGECGRGKSFRAAQICKAIIERGYKARFTSLTEIERALWDGEKADVYKNLDRYDLLVLDDFGAERSTEYLKEIRYNIVDMRYTNGKPLLITTNVTKFHGDDISDQRTYSRIREKSLFIKIEGKDRREGALSATEIEKLMNEGGWEDL